MFEIAIHNSRQQAQQTIRNGRLTLGRSANSADLVVDDPMWAEKQLEVVVDSSQPTEGVLHNRGAACVLGDGTRLVRGGIRKLALPAQWIVGETRVQILSAPDEFGSDAWTFLDAFHSTEMDLSQQLAKMGAAPSSTTLIQWFSALSQMQGWSTQDPDFDCRVSRLVFEPGGMDTAFLLRCDESDWTIGGSHVPDPWTGITFPRPLVERAAATRKTTLWDGSKSTGSHSSTAMVAAPILDADQRVQGMLVGLRHPARNRRKGIRCLEAAFIQLLAEATGAAWRRHEAEQNQARQLWLIEQVFPPSIAKRIHTDPHAMGGTEREVTMLFADLRDFTRISECIGTQRSYRLLADIMDGFTEIILQHQGVVIDYFGDGLAAFWNAPLDQEHHAEWACAAGLDMLERLVDLNHRWYAVVGQSLRLGIGIHTGQAQVGNSGSRFRLKYGPRGPAVNLASRVEQATKQLDLPILISEATARRVAATLLTRRIFSLSLKGVEAAVPVFEVARRDGNGIRVGQFQKYEAALSAFEEGKVALAIERAQALVDFEHPDPALSFLLARCLEANEARFSPNLDDSPSPRHQNK